MNITNNIKYIGVNDHRIDLFEGQYSVPNGMSYNSYVILDEKIAIMDTVDAGFTDEWMENLRAALGGRTPDYLIVQHMEPDHSANITAFTEAYPDAVVVASARAFSMMKAFYGNDFADRRVVVGEGDSLSLGTHTLCFVTAPMVHWPEVIVTFEASTGTLFSADGFGKFGALDVDEPWDDEARRYYIGIVGKYGAQVQALLKKAAALPIRRICPLHGPVLDSDLEHYLSLYDAWSAYRPEEIGIVLAYTSIYGNTRRAVLRLAELLRERTSLPVVVHDLARTDWALPVADAFRYSRLVLATTTYNGDIFPYMRSFLDHLTERGFANRRVALIENGSWAPQGVRVMRGMLEGCKNLTWIEPTVRILSAPNAETEAALAALADALTDH